MDMSALICRRRPTRKRPDVSDWFQERFIVANSPPPRRLNTQSNTRHVRQRLLVLQRLIYTRSRQTSVWSWRRVAVTVGCRIYVEKLGLKNLLNSRAYVFFFLTPISSLVTCIRKCFFCIVFQALCHATASVSFSHVINKLWDLIHMKPFSNAFSNALQVKRATWLCMVGGDVNETLRSNTETETVTFFETSVSLSRASRPQLSWPRSSVHSCIIPHLSPARNADISSYRYHCNVIHN